MESNHFLMSIFNGYTLALVTYIIAFLGYFNDNKKRKKKIKIAGISLLTVSLIGQFFFQYQADEKSIKRENELQDLILYQERSKPYGTLRSPIKSNSNVPILSLGSYTKIKCENGKCAGFNLKIINGEAVITIDILDKQGNLIGQIIDNQWWVISNPSVILDRNYNANSLEIINTKNEPIFQIQIIGNEVYLAGVIYSKDIIPIMYGPWLHELQNRERTLFKYPSIRYHGVLSDIKSFQ